MIGHLTTNIERHSQPPLSPPLLLQPPPIDLILSMELFLYELSHPVKETRILITSLSHKSLEDCLQCISSKRTQFFEGLLSLSFHSVSLSVRLLSLSTLSQNSTCCKARFLLTSTLPNTSLFQDDYPLIASVCLLLSMAAMHSWPLYQLDIKNAFLHGDLAEKVYMEQPPGFVAHGKSGSDQNGIQKLKQDFFTHFQTKDLGKLKHFLGIEIAQSSSGVILSQRKYALDILEETGDPGRYRRLVGKLNYSPLLVQTFLFLTPGQGVLYENRGHTRLLVTQMQIRAGSP
ncbi:hypothetical protein CK203_077241 [Vitis vinifera]|uniref:Reverse transcriptase Ty1/copia-type domain-containing protein n=1 Tax=Vitis vinifera TaxID=29760 RepID=A0A438BU68_VITVI|nr:hypothetical protein CK203_077241 [Vitis vinifera]